VHDPIERFDGDARLQHFWRDFFDPLDQFFIGKVSWTDPSLFLSRHFRPHLGGKRELRWLLRLLRPPPVWRTQQLPVIASKISGLLRLLNRNENSVVIKFEIQQ